MELFENYSRKFWIEQKYQNEENVQFSSEDDKQLYFDEEICGRTNELKKNKISTRNSISKLNRFSKPRGLSE